MTAHSTERNQLLRKPERGSYDMAVIRSILAAGQVCHVGLVDDDVPVVIPTAYGLLDTVDGRTEIVVHGLPASRMLGVLRAGSQICVTVTLLDGLVLARSAFEHSMNYRSVVVFGRARWLRDSDEKLAALEAISEHLLPGRWADVRKPARSELNRTHVLAIPIDQASAKVRSGPPSDDEDPFDAEPMVGEPWTGVLPARLSWGPPEPDGDFEATPSYLDRSI